ncbi:MAG: PAS domain S-box protein, partial [Spirochaetes bacterium]|nr:PAS domain S-box protein [Spirochaetota bacterium]
TERKKAEEALSESEKFNSSLLNNSPNPIIVINSDSSIRYINPSLEKITGFSNDELIGRKAPYPWLMEETKEKINNEMKKAMYKEEYRHEELFQKKNGEQFWVETTSIAVRKNEKIIYYLENWVDITERKKAEDDLRNSREQLKKLSANLQYIIEEERSKISREIHDELGQTLTALNMDLFWMSKKFYKAQKHLVDKSRAMKNLIDTAIKNVQKICSELRPRMLDDLGLIPAIDWQIKEFQERSGIECKVVWGVENINIKQEYSTAIFRIFREILTNIIRHANATFVEISLKKEKNIIILEVIDNGIGIEEEKIHDISSLGLIGMKERANYLGGDLKIEKIPSNGTKIVIIIPVNSE